MSYYDFRLTEVEPDYWESRSIDLERENESLKEEIFLLKNTIDQLKDSLEPVRRIADFNDGE